MRTMFAKNKISTLSEYYNFVENNIKGLVSHTSNCIGTGLFCVGEINFDKYQWGEKPNRILSKLTQLNVPIKGALIALYRRNCESNTKYCYHLGIIMRGNPLLITSRKMNRGFVVENENSKDFCKKRCYCSTESRYFVPKKLEAFL